MYSKSNVYLHSDNGQKLFTRHHAKHRTKKQTLENLFVIKMKKL